MRTYKLEELRSYINELSVKRKELIDKSGKFLGIERYNCELNNGHTIVREKIVKGGSDGSAAIILPVTDEGNTLLVIQPRVFTEMGVSVELPAGYVDSGESYEEAARRELFEETGYVPENMRLLASFYQDQGCSSAYNQAFLAENCKKVGEQHLDKDEFIRYFECSYDEALELIDRGLICDAQSQLVLERSRQYIKKNIVY